MTKAKTTPGSSPWIKLRKKLTTDGRVLLLSKKIGTDRDATLGKLVRLWSLADDHADDDGTLFGYTAEDINTYLNCANFCECLPPDWIDLSGEYVKLPEYQEHNGETAKRRAVDAKRKREERALLASSESPESVQDLPDKNGTRREEKRREESTKRESTDTTTIVGLPSTAPSLSLNGDNFKGIKITPAEIQALERLYGKPAADFYIKKGSNWCITNKTPKADFPGFVRQILEEDRSLGRNFFDPRNKRETDMSQHASRRPAREVMAEQLGPRQPRRARG